MAKTVIFAKNVESGIRRVFETLEEASVCVGISDTAISQACVEGRPAKGWLFRRVERVYAVHERAHNKWMMAVMNARNSGYLEYQNPARRIAQSELDQVRDVTLGWYFQEGE